MGCCLCRYKNSWSHQSTANGDLSNCQITRGVQKDLNDKRSLLDIIKLVNISADSESKENSICSGEDINDTCVGILSNDRAVTQLYSQSDTPLTTQKKQTAPIDFPLPVEIIEIVMAFLSANDLLALASVGTERIKISSFCFLEIKLPKYRNNQISEVSNLLWQMSSNGDMERIKQKFAYAKQRNIEVKKFKVIVNEVHYERNFTIMEKRIKKKLSPLLEASLIQAARKGHAQVCEYFISQQNVDIDARSSYNKYSKYDDTVYDTGCCNNGCYKWTVLMVAVDCNQTEVIKMLLRHNPDIKAKDDSGYHATYIAAYQGYIDALKMLVEKEGNVIDFRGPHGMTPLIAASSRYGWVDICKYLVEEKNANAELVDEFGRTALDYASDYTIIEILKKNRNKKYQYLKNYKEERQFEYMMKKFKNVMR